MNLNLKATKFVKASDIIIPDIFNRRLKTGIERIDRAFGSGILPGSAFTVTGSPGSGKTTFLLQTLDQLARHGYKVGYASGEESVEMLGNTCRRIGVRDVGVANVTNLDQLVKLTEEFDALVVDSFATLTSDHKSSRAHEKYCIQELCKASKANECAVGIVLHISKSGQYKGSTLIPHSVDTVIHLHRDMIEGQPDNYVSMVVNKNRFGPTCEEQLLLTSRGFDWTATLPAPEAQAAPKSVRKDREMKELLKHTHLDIAKAQDILKSTRQRASYILRELTIKGRISKTGRGGEAKFKRNENN